MDKRNGNRFLGISLLLVLIATLLLPLSMVSANGTGLVYIVPVEETIERGLYSFLERSITEANEVGANHIILEVNTLGGSVTDALDIGKIIRESNVPVTAFIRGSAISAGAYISLNADTILMTEGSTIGASAVRDLGGDEVDPKATSAWRKSMRSAAEANGRNGTIAEAMVDPKVQVDVKGVTKDPNEPLSLSSQEAVQSGIADKVVMTREEALAFLNVSNADVVVQELSIAEKIARIVTNPYVIPVLFVIGLLGIAIELFVPGFGIAGVIGVAAFGLYFFGHYIAGFANMEEIFLFIAGIVLMIVEIFVPGFGIFGALGIVSLFTGVGLAAYDTTHGLVSLGIAFLIATIVVVVLFRVFGVKGVWERFILRDELNAEAGYNSATDYRSILGEKGKTLTPLRPAGAAEILGKRYDVVSDGTFLHVDQRVEVVRVEGTRIVVRALQDE